MLKTTPWLYIGAIAALLLLAPALAPATEMSSKRDCAICHVMWLDDFRTDKKPLIEWQPGNVLMKDTQGVVSSEEICYSCHDGYVSDSRAAVWSGNGHKTFVKPSAKVSVPDTLPLSNKDEIYCGTCHSAHGAGAAPDDSSGATSFFREKNVDSQLCTMCHIREAGAAGTSSHPLRSGDKPLPAALFTLGAQPATNRNKVICQSCHRTHGARGEKLTIVANQDSQLCLICHSKQQAVIASKHDLRSSFPAEKNIKNQNPAESGPCGICHIAHNAAGGRLWARQLPEGKDARLRYCRSCHSKGQVAEKAVISGTSHPLDVNPFEKIEALAQSKKPLALPLFNSSGALDSGGKMTCATCHDPHGAEDVAPAALPGQALASPVSPFFLRKHAEDTCRVCHLDKNLIANSKHDMNKMAPEAENIAGKKPAESGLCGSCHLVHRGQQAFLWAREINDSSRRSATDICLSCHNEQGLAAKKVIKPFSHPLNVGPTQKGLTTSLPLFDSSGRKTKDGDMTCLTCHEPHRWDPSKVITADHYQIEGDGQNSFLRLPSSGNARLCKDCHKALASVEKTDHDLTLTAPDARNLRGQTPAESGVCGTCHLVHNGENWVRLWARDLGAGDSLMDTLCNSCHAPTGLAKAKVPQISSHPTAKEISSAGRDKKGAPDFFPLFHKNYGELVKAANVSCASCHNAHQWDPHVRGSGPGTNIEGDAGNSFLRSRSALTPCKDCHGLDALYRYKYFHKASARKALRK